MEPWKSPGMTTSGGSADAFISCFSPKMPPRGVQRGKKDIHLQRLKELGEEISWTKPFTEFLEAKR